LISAIDFIRFGSLLNNLLISLIPSLVITPISGIIFYNSCLSERKKNILDLDPSITELKIVTKDDKITEKRQKLLQLLKTNDELAEILGIKNTEIRNCEEIIRDFNDLFIEKEELTKNDEKSLELKPLDY